VTLADPLQTQVIRRLGSVVECVADTGRVLELRILPPEFPRLVDLVEDAGDDLRKADEAERRVIEEVRRLGRDLLGDWADEQVAKRADELERTPGIWREGKKSPLAQYLR
jgi:hypothetical protein